MNIQPIAEEAHNTAMLALTAERQELLFYRGRIKELEDISDKLSVQCQKLREEIVELKSDQQQE